MTIFQEKEIFYQSSIELSNHGEKKGNSIGRGGGGGGGVPSKGDFPIPLVVGKTLTVFARSVAMFSTCRGWRPLCKCLNHVMNEEKMNQQFLSVASYVLRVE